MSVHKDKATNTWRVLYRYAHLFPSTQQTMADQLNSLRGGMANVS